MNNKNCNSLYETPVCETLTVNAGSLLCASADATNDPFDIVDWSDDLL